MTNLLGVAQASKVYLVCICEQNASELSHQEIKKPFSKEQCFELFFERFDYFFEHAHYVFYLLAFS